MKNQNNLPMDQNCVVCHSKDASVDTREFKKTYMPSYTYGLLLLAPLIGLLLMIAVRVEHSITLPFCERCWKGKKFMTLMQGLSGLLFLGSIPAGVALMLQFENGWAFFVPIVFTLVLLLALEVAKRKYQPKYKVVDKDRVVIETLQGDLEFAKTTKATLHPA